MKYHKRILEYMKSRKETAESDEVDKTGIRKKGNRRRPRIIYEETIHDNATQV